MTATPVHVVATACRTPGGLSTASTAAAARARICRIKEHPFMIDPGGLPLYGALDSTVAADVLGVERMIALARPCLEDLLTSAPLLPGRPKPLPLFMGLPEYRPGWTTHEAERLLDVLVAHGLGLGFELVCEGSASGHAAGLSALLRGEEKLRDREVSWCIVGAVDSYFSVATLDWLCANRKVLTSDNHVGLIPGEGAAFLLLMTDDTLRSLDVPSLGRVRSVGCVSDSPLGSADASSQGRALARAVRSAYSSGGTPTIDEVYCDINGERCRVEEWAFALLELSEEISIPHEYTITANLWGDLGAASGPLHIALATQAWRLGYARGPQALIWTSSEAGLRSAALIERAAEVVSDPRSRPDSSYAW